MNKNTLVRMAQSLNEYSCIIYFSIKKQTSRIICLYIIKLVICYSDTSFLIGMFFLVKKMYSAISFSHSL